MTRRNKPGAPHPVRARLLGLPEIFDGRTFWCPTTSAAIPEQREVTDLLKDIEQQSMNVRTATNGTLVLTRPMQDQPGQFHVVEGVQRVTTLVLLMAQAAARLEPAQAAAMCARYHGRGKTVADTPVLWLKFRCPPVRLDRMLGQRSGGATAATLATPEGAGCMLAEWRVLGCTPCVSDRRGAAGWRDPVRLPGGTPAEDA